MRDGFYLAQPISTGDYKLNYGPYPDLGEAQTKHRSFSSTGFLKVLRKSGKEAWIVDSKGADVTQVFLSRLIEGTAPSTKDLAKRLIEGYGSGVEVASNDNTLGPAFNEEKP